MDAADPLSLDAKRAQARADKKAKTGGNKNKAAQLLRLNRTTLVEMVKRKRLNVA